MLLSSAVSPILVGTKQMNTVNRAVLFKPLNTKNSKKIFFFSIRYTKYLYIWQLYRTRSIVLTETRVQRSSGSWINNNSYTIQWLVKGEKKNKNLKRSTQVSSPCYNASVKDSFLHCLPEAMFTEMCTVHINSVIVHNYNKQKSGTGERYKLHISQMK